MGAMALCSMDTSPLWMHAEVARELSPLSADRARALADIWSVRLRDLLSTYLPLLLMLLLAAATWWLVRITPVPGAPRATDAASQAPDYILNDVEFVRYRGDGSLMARVRSRELRHYPAGDRMELDDAQVVADHPEGDIKAQARRGFFSEEGRRIRLEGDVNFRREATATQPAFRVQTSVLELDVENGRAWTDAPVQWEQEGAVLTASGFEYEQATSLLQLSGPVSARISPRAPAPR